jgi:hypothetical protein
MVCGGGINLWDKLCRNDRQYISMPKSHLLAIVRNALKIEKRRIQQKRNKIPQREINYLFIIVRTCVWISICEMTIHKYKRTLRNNNINKPEDQNFEVSIDEAGEQQTLNKQKKHTGLRNSVNGINPIALNPCLIQYSKTIYSF